MKIELSNRTVDTKASRQSFLISQRESSVLTTKTDLAILRHDIVSTHMAMTKSSLSQFRPVMRYFIKMYRCLFCSPNVSRLGGCPKTLWFGDKLILVLSVPNYGMNSVNTFA